MDQQDPVIARLHRLEADDRRLKRIGAAALGLLALGLLTGMLWQQDPDPTVQDPAEQDQDIVTAYRSDGTKAWQGSFVNGRREGPWIVWNARWTLLGRFENDERVGTWRKFSNHDAQLIEEGSFADGVRTGTWRTWFDYRGRSPDEWAGITRTLESSGTYDEGQRNGMWTFWYWNGQKRAEGILRNGRRDGDWKVWHDDGSIDEVQTGVYENGTKVR